MSKLTKQAVNALRPPEKGQAFVWDGELRGFGVRAIPSGLKTFVLQYRNAEGRSRRMVLGRYGVLTVEQARDQARIKLGAVADGADPAEEAGPRETITVAEVCDWYLAEAEAGRILGRRNRPIKPSTLGHGPQPDRNPYQTAARPSAGSRAQARRYRGHAGGHRRPGRRPKPRSAGRGGVTTGGAGVAARTVSTLQSLLAHAKLLDVIASNPAVGVRKLAGKKKERRLSVAEIREARRRDARRRDGRRAPGRPGRRAPHAFDGLSDFGGPGAPARLAACR